MSSPGSSNTSNHAQATNSASRTQPGSAQASGRGSLEYQELSLEEAVNRLEIESRLREGAENLLQVLDTRTRERTKEPREARRVQVMEELNQINTRITALKSRVSDLTSTGGHSKSYRRQRSEEKLGARPKLATIKSHSSAEQTTDSGEKSIWSVADAIADLSLDNQDSATSIGKANHLVHLLRQHENMRQDSCTSVMSDCILRFCTSTTSNVVAAGYRIARHVAHDDHSARFILDTGIERSVIHSLAKDHRYTSEREQALKLVRALYTISPAYMSSGIVRALVALAETQDRLTPICLETLSEMALLRPEMLAKHGGFRCLFDSLIEGSPTLTDEAVMVFVHEMDHPETRRHFKPGRDLEVLFSPFTEYVDGKKEVAMEERLLTSSLVIVRILHTWPGLLCLSMYQYRGIKSIVDALRVPMSSVRNYILDLLFSVLSIDLNNLSSIFLAGRRLTTLGRIPISAENTASITGRTSKQRPARINLQNQFAALKLLLFLEVGVLDALMIVVEDKIDLFAARKATLLVGEILQLANTLLPLAMCRTLQTLPRLFSSAMDLRADHRFAATSALYQIESLNRTKKKTSLPRLVNSADQLNSKRGQRQVEQVKIKMGLQIDDSHFRNLLLDTQVLSTKNYTKWHWDTLTELVQGPLLNPKRLEESIRATKFMKRLLAFYRPFTHRFSAIRNTKPNQKYVKFGCLLLNTLLANPEGIKYLTESKLLRQLSECLAQMDPMNHVTASDALFSKARLEETLCHGYFEFLGVLTTHAQGISMIERWRMFSSLYHLTDLRSRGDLVRLFLTHMDYTHEGHPRIIMSKALTTGLLDVRLFATELLSTLIIEPSDTSTKTADWAIRLLVIQLYDPNTEVCEAAVQVLERACSSQEYLEYIVRLRPALDHLGEIGGPLLLRFLATSVGFHYLKELNYIDREMDDWFHGRNDEYVVQIEASLLNTNAPISNDDGARPSEHIPAHFYGELAKTEEGVSLLLEKGHFDRYVDLLHERWQEQEDHNMIHKLKAALWAIGSIGATERGAPFLKNSQVISSISQIAKKSQIATLKGTAYLVLGMLSQTMVGVELIRRHDWDAVLTNMGVPTGICVPSRITNVLNMEPWSDMSENDVVEHTFAISQDPNTNEILRSISNLSNHILANDAAKTLIRLRQKYPDKFMDLDLFDRTFDLLAHYSYKLAIRKFLLELFSKDTLQMYMTKRCHATRLYRAQLVRGASTEADAQDFSPDVYYHEQKRSE